MRQALKTLVERGLLPLACALAAAACGPKLHPLTKVNIRASTDEEMIARAAVV